MKSAVSLRTLQIYVPNAVNKSQGTMKIRRHKVPHLVQYLPTCSELCTCRTFLTTVITVPNWFGRPREEMCWKRFPRKCFPHPSKRFASKSSEGTLGCTIFGVVIVRLRPYIGLPYGQKLTHRQLEKFGVVQQPMFPSIVGEVLAIHEHGQISVGRMKQRVQTALRLHVLFKDLGRNGINMKARSLIA